MTLRALGRPNLYFGVTGGNMDSMVNRYTSERRLRSDDAYTPGGEGGRRPDRAVIVYSQRCREAFRDVPIVLGGIEASLRRIAHFDYWQEKVRRSVLMDAKADILLFGNAERAIVELSHRLAAGEAIEQIRDLRGTAFALKALPTDWTIIDSTRIDEPGRIAACIRTRIRSTGPEADANRRLRPAGAGATSCIPRARGPRPRKSLPCIRDRRARIARIRRYDCRLSRRQERPGACTPTPRACCTSSPTRATHAHWYKRHGDRDVWINPPPIPLRTPELDRVFELPYQRVPHPAYGDARIPAYEMIRFSVNIMRGCFGGCSFCSITEHEGRIIQNRSEQSILREIENIRDHTPGFTGMISDLGGPTANMWRLHCKDPKIESSCRRLSCVYPGICDNLKTDQMPLVRLYRKARELPGIKRVFIASGLRYDIAVETPEYVKELVSHHVGGYLKIAPEHTEQGPLSKMMKPGMGTYERFKAMFDKYSKAGGQGTVPDPLLHRRAPRHQRRGHAAISRCG